MTQREGGQPTEPWRPAELSLDRVLESIPDGVFVLDRELRIVHLNPAAERVVGRAAPEVRGLPLGEVFPDAVAAFQPRYEQALREGVPVSFEEFSPRLQRWFEVRAVPEPDHLLVFARDVTDRRRAQQTMERERGLLESLIQATDVMLVYLDPRFDFVWVNAAYAATCGMSPEEMIGRNHFELYPDPENEAIFRRVLQTGEPVFFKDKPFEFPDQPERGVTYWDWSLVPVKAEDGAVRALVFSLRETTKYKRADLALRRSERRFRRLVEVAAQIVWVTNERGEVEEDSPSWRAFTGRPLADWLGRNWLDAIHPDDRARVQATWVAALRDAADYSVEFRLRNAAGEYRLLTARAAPILRDDGTVAEWIGMNTDITDRRAAEDALRVARDHADALALFPEQNPDPVLRVAGDGRLLYANPASRSAIPDLLLPDGTVAEAVADGARRARGSGGNVREEFTSGGRTFLTSFVPCDEYVNVYAQEITSIKQAERELRRLNERLRVADRRKDEFLAVLSHELRNPLGPIRAAVHLLDHLPPGHEQAAQAQAIIGRQVGQLARLVDDLLDLNRIATGKIGLQRAPVDLCALARRTADDYRALFAERRVALETILPPGEVLVEGDVARLAQAVGNVLQNALKFTPAGGGVRLSVEARGGAAEVRVRDTGVGIDPALLVDIFEPFTQADRTLDRSSGGLGLGLALVAGIVRQHGGEVEATSDGPGAGAEFTLRLPCDGRLAPLGETPAVAVSPASRSRRVLVIEDNPDAAESLRQVLLLFGHEVETAESGPEGVERFGASLPDTVVCDIGLPGIDGYEVARRIRAAEPGRRVLLIALTGYGFEEHQRRALEAGFDAHLTKPVDLDSLLRLLS